MRVTPTVIGLLLLVGIASANPDAEKAARAAKLFEEGRELIKSNNHEAACERFAASLALVHAVGTELNLADCHEHRGALTRAWELFDAAAREDATTFPARSQMARGRADKLAARLVTIVVKPAEPTLAGLAISIAGVSQTPAVEITYRTDPGTIEVVATAPNRPRFAKSVTAREGERVVVEILPPAITATALPKIEPPRDDPSGPRRRRIYIAVGVGGGGVLALTVGGVLALSARSAYNDQLDSGACVETGGKLVCTPEGANAVDSANNKADLATGVIVAGVALVGVAAVVYFTAPRRETTIVPAASRDTVGVILSGRF